MGKALYRKYRSKTLDEVIGQKHVTDILARAIKQGRVSHAYLLSGPRGVGKTSVARILAHEINQLPYDEENSHLDIIEIDAASNNGVEDVRDLREKVQIAPASATKKIYIIDEVHMLSKAAFNALLKTLEEPPEHVVFILATTNVEKLPATIVSRTQRFSFRPISLDDIAAHLGEIAKKEGIKISDDALKIIAIRGDGSFRDSISLLDQLSSMVDDKKEITSELIEEALGLAPNQLIDQIIETIEDHNFKKIVEIIDQTIANGTDVNILVDQLTAKVRTQISDKPNLIKLLDALIEVPKSPRPDLKLISVLASNAYQKQPSKTVALRAPVLEVSASVSEIKKQIVAEKQNTKTITKEKTELKIPIVPKVDVAIDKSNAKPFDWNTLVDHTRRNYVAIYSVLSKCGHELNGDILTLYTINKFYKKKLDDPKYSPLISKSLQELGVYDLNIVTIPTNSPLKDSQAAAVADIMGGGEEVILEAA